ncbi:MAG TPA: group II intron reverse transcriptase/maturase [Thermodesulfobacteriota bacterium]|nr:group II intron reverse transcriptase/maturase [Thermodesulfobacteriota bacterium]
MGQQSHSATNTKLNRIAWLSKQDPGKKFECLMHLFNPESLIECFHELDKNKAVGVDGITKMEYGANLQSNIEQLITKMKNMAYRPGPVREVLIPKEGKPGATRPLGISNLEDKIVQKMTQKVLESIYEPLFLESSHGFRSGRSCHTAIKGLLNHLYNHEIQTVIDIDFKNFFGTIEHQLLENILKEKIKDPKFMRYINRMFKSGVLTEGDLKISEEGVPQGSICSPVMANIFAHYAIDIWVEEMVKPACKGTIGLFRYADDAVICCQYDEDAQRIRKTLGKRLEKFKLQLNEEKTKLVAFDKKLARQGITQGTFDFLGFTFYWDKSRSGGTIPKLRTRRKTMRAKLKKATEWIKQVRDEQPLKEIWNTLKAKLRGHVQYYGVSHNSKRVEQFIEATTKIMFKWLNRRSQRKSFTWKGYNLYLAANPLPRAKVIHRMF